MRYPKISRWCAIVVLACQGRTPSQDDRVALWREDLAFLAAELPSRHKNPFTVISKEAFLAAVAKLDGELAGLDDLHVQGRLAELVASIGDSHTRIDTPELSKHRLPVSFFWWKDGLRLAEGPKEIEKDLGSQVLAIGGKSVAEVAKILARLDPFENASRERAAVPNWLTQPRALHYLGIIASADGVPVDIVRKDGSKGTIILAPGERKADAVLLSPAATPVTAIRRGKLHDFTHLEAEKLLYIQYNSCTTTKQQDLDAFGEKLAALCAGNDVKKLVIDVRANGGGNSLLGDALFARLAKEEPMKSRTGVFCIIGRGTFSSAILNAKALQKRYGAILVGEPTAGSPNHFGEIKTLELSKSKLKVSYSTKRFEHGPPGATTITPDHLVELEFADWLAGKDLLLDKIRSL